jgi:lipopolysaccharide cholinephosphotransferase
MPTPTDAVLPRTEQKITDAIYGCLACVHGLFTDAGIKYSLFGGSLLGAVRPGGMIPWDDGGDVVIHSQDTAKVYDLRDRFSARVVYK